MNILVTPEGDLQIHELSNQVYPAAILAFTRKELLAMRESVAA